jgi:integrase
MNWCKERGYITNSPIDVLSMPAPILSRDRVLSEGELKKFLAYFNSEPSKDFHVIVTLLLLRGQRRNEIGHLCKSWVGKEAITFPASFTKNKREHVLPLGALAKEVLKIPTHEGDFVFGREWNYWNKPKRWLDEGCGVSGWVLHDLRRTCATGMADLGVQPHIIERVLNHASGIVSGVSATYNRATYQKEMLEALTKWEDYIVKLSTG